jgi:hypothetical protein
MDWGIFRHLMIVPTRWSKMLGAVAALAMVFASGCATVDKWKQEHREARIHREQIEQAVALNNADSKADRDAKSKRAQHDAALQRLQTELAARGDPDSLAASALFARVQAGATSSSSLELAARATAGAPQRADLAFVQLQLCQSAPGCDTAPLEARLHQLDPQNGIPWAYALLRADRAKNDADRNIAREGLAQSKRVDLYWNAIASHLGGAAAGRAGFDFSAALVEVIGIEAAFMTPMPPAAAVCTADEILQPDVLTQCRQIAAAFRRGDTVLLEAYGNALAMRLWPEGSAERAELAAERRGLHYQMDLMTNNSAKLNSEQATRSLATFLAKYPTEQTAFHAWYVDLGLSPDPPPGWADHYDTR